MTQVVLLSAGQGRRLAPLTDQKPKCLVQIGGRSILDWQLDAIAACGLQDVTVVTGFQSRSVETALALRAPDINVRTRFNPFYSVADNIGSCWAARDLIGEDTVLINGDTLFDPRILAHLLAEATAPITVTIDHKAAYDDDDMKVRLKDGQLARIGKKLEGRIDGESIGMSRYLGAGGQRFGDKMASLLRDPASVKLWYLSIIDMLAIEGGVGAVAIDGLPWAEVDFPADLPSAATRAATFDWSGAAVPATNTTTIQYGDNRS